jgi:thiamine-monophosphate kinase
MRRSQGPTIDDLGETEALRRIQRLIPSPSKKVVVGIGDDAAVCRRPEAEFLVATTDPIRAGVHFPETHIPWRELGYKAVLVNASDIVAMGGKPAWFLVSLGLPGKIEWKEVRALYQGFQEGLEVCGAEFLGGDLDQTEQAQIEATLLGSVPQKGILRLDGAAPDEWIYVTGTLGDSRAGLEILLRSPDAKSRVSKEEKSLVNRHLRPPYLFDAMREIRRRFRPTALTDISDGLARDARRLCEASGVGCRIDLENIPISSQCFFFCERNGEDPRLFAASGGEDYQLLFTSKIDPEKAPIEAAGIPVTAVGRTTKPPRRVSFRLCGQTVKGIEGYEHFRAGSD